MYCANKSRTNISNGYNMLRAHEYLVNRMLCAQLRVQVEMMSCAARDNTMQEMLSFVKAMGNKQVNQVHFRPKDELAPVLPNGSPLSRSLGLRLDLSGFKRKNCNSPVTRDDTDENLSICSV